MTLVLRNALAWAPASAVLDGPTPAEDSDCFPWRKGEAPRRQIFTGPRKIGKQAKMVSSRSPSDPSPSWEQVHSLQATIPFSGLVKKQLRFFSRKPRSWCSTGAHSVGDADWSQDAWVQVTR